MTVPTRATDHRSAAEPRQWVTHCEKLPEMTRHLLIALQPRRVGTESNHLGYDSTAQSRQGAVVATRYLDTVRSMQRDTSPHHPNQQEEN